MRKIIFSIPISLDGYIEGPHRELDWVIADDELHDFYSNLLEKSDLVIYGRVTYELMINYWPNALSDPTLTAAMRQFAETLNPMAKIVFSKTLTNVGWNTQIHRQLFPEEIIRLKNQPGKDIALGGGASIAQAFIQSGLVDEYQLVIQPVAIGNGKPLFKGIPDLPKLSLLWSKPFRSGAIALCYQPDGNV